METIEVKHEKVIVLMDEEGNFLSDFTINGNSNRNKVNGSDSITSSISINISNRTHISNDEAKIINMAKVIGYQPKVVDVHYEIKEFDSNQFPVVSQTPHTNQIDNIFKQLFGGE